ncbi:hypothetical protein AB0E81_00835 [Streptomyces sp. NPDC033538]|uniref:hypothetical protein n=1 Tax=Streptomyces sp. NPDC033538 TaxID=3155367 RepID=UPI0033F74CB6
MGSMKVTLCAAAALTAALAPVAPVGAAGAVGAAGTSTPAAYEVDGPGASEAPPKPAPSTPTPTPGGDVDRRHPDSPTARTAPAARTAPTAPASPVAPVDAGGGGTARHLAAADSRDEARPEPPGTAHTVTGLVLAGIAAVAVALRGVRGRSRGTD